MLELINEKRSEYMMAESLYLEGQDEGGYIEDLPPYPSHAPVPAPPALSKFQIYNDPIEFANVDQIAISVSFFFSFWKQHAEVFVFLKIGCSRRPKIIHRFSEAACGKMRL